MVGIIVSAPDGFWSCGILAHVEMLRASGCTPVLLPPLADIAARSGAERDACARGLLAPLCGLVGPGGDDVEPALYGQRSIFARGWNAPRDRFEARLVAHALHAHLYLLGICRSHQLWNVVAGGTLAQDVEQQHLSARSQRQTDFGIPLDQPFVVRNPDGTLAFENRVRLTWGSQLQDLSGTDDFVTNSLHHQAVAEPGRDMRVVGTVFDEDTRRHTVEATERWNGISVQWHPELMTSDAAQQRLYATVARRAHVFFLVRTLLARGEHVDTQRVLAEMARTPERFHESDGRWVQTELAPRL